MNSLKQKEQIKRRIIASALHTFVEKGLPNIELDEIGLRVGIPKDEISYYFNSKEHLIESILQKHLELMAQHLTLENQSYTISKLLEIVKRQPTISEEESFYLPIYSEAFLPYVSVELKREYQSFFKRLHSFFIENLTQEDSLYATTNIMIAILDGAILHHGTLLREKREKQSLQEELLTSLLWLLKWQQSVWINRKKEFYRIKNLSLNSIQKVKYTIISYAKKRDKIKLRPRRGFWHLQAWVR